MPRIPLSYTPIDEEKIAGVLRRYAGKQHGELITDFEKAIASITGARYVVALNSGTASIHLALKALDVGKDDEVLTSTFTYVASVNPVVYQGGIPVLIDSEADTWNMDPALLEAAIRDRGKKPKAIIVVHGYGVPAKMNDIITIAQKYRIPVIEDAAEALGSTFQGSHLGTLTEVGILSFNNNKIVTTYGGGALLTNNEKIYRQVLHWASQSRENKSYYEHLEIGYNYRMSPLNAACGLAQLEEFNPLLRDKKRVSELYKKEFSVNPDVHFVRESEGTSSNHWLTTILIKSLKKTGITIEQIQRILQDHGIETRPLWKPMHLQPLYKAAPFYGTIISEQLFYEGLCLPSGNTITPEDVRSIAKIILDKLN